MTKEQREKMAKELAERHGAEVQDWMLWDGWHSWVGCENCNEGGQAASCWGYQGCHGHENGCGCFGCAVTDLEADLLAQMGISTERLDGGCVHRVHDIALRIADGKLSLSEAIEAWHRQPNLPVGVKVRFWHADLTLPR